MDNPVEAAANELKKWIEQIKKIMAMLEAQEKAKIAEQKAIGDKALAAHKEMVAKTKHDELIKELKDIREGIRNTPETPGKAEALDQVNEIEKTLEDQSPKLDAPDSNDLDSKQEIDQEDQSQKQEAPDNNVLDPKQEIDEIDPLDNSVGEDLTQSGPQAGGRSRSMSLGEKMSSKDPKPGSTLDMMRKGGDELEIVKDFEKGVGNKLGQDLTKSVGKLNLG